MSFLIYLAGGGLVGALMRWWRPRFGWSWIAGYWLAAGAFFAAPLTTPALQVPTDIVYGLWPWVEMVEGPVRPANGLLTDIPLLVLPYRALVRDRLLRFEAPLWAGEMGTGQPLLGNAQSAPFSPLGLLTLPLPPVRALPVMAALKLFLSLLLTDSLLTALGAGRAGAAFAAFAFTFSVFSTCWALHPLGMASAWLPGVMLGLVMLRRGERGALAGLVTCAAGMAVSGHPETLAHTALAAAAVAIALLLAAGTPLRSYLAGLAAAAALTAGLTAPVLLPVLEALPDAARLEMVRRAPQETQPPPFAAPTLRVLFDPLVYGSPRDADWQGPWNWNELCSGYAGLLALALACAAALDLRGRPLAILGGGAVAIAAAFAIPPFLDIVRALPPFDVAANGRLRLFWVLAVAVAGGLGLEPLTARRRGRWIAAGCCAAAGLALALAQRPAASWQQVWWSVTLATAGLFALAFVWLALRPRSGGRATGWLPWLAVAALALDLGLLNGRFLPVLPARFDLAPPPVLTALAGERNADLTTPFRVIARGAGLVPNLASYYRLWDPRSDEPMQPARAALVVGCGLRPGYEIGQPIYMARRFLPNGMLSYLGVRYLLASHREAFGAPWEEAWEGQGGKLWRNTAARPLFFMPASWRPARDPQQALDATLANPDLAESAVAELPAAPALSSAGSAELPRHQVGATRIRRAWSNGFELEAGGPAGGLVVSSVAWSRGWRLTVDGANAPLVRVNAGFLGFLVPAGRHLAVLEYRPDGWVWGLRLCGATLVALLALVGLPAARRRGRLGLILARLEASRASGGSNEPDLK